MVRLIHSLTDMQEAAADAIAAHGQWCVNQYGCFIWLLCGGSTPGPIFRLLSEAPYSKEPFWRKTHFYWGDERCVPPDSELSNFRMARENLLDRLHIPDSRIHRMAAEQQDLDLAAKQYESILPAVPDLVLLGIGADGHIASIFPGSPALRETKRRVMAVEGPQYVQSRCRMTITPLVLLEARKVLVVATGADKAAVVMRALRIEGDVNKTPARLAHDTDWLLDGAAGKEIIEEAKREIKRR